MTLKIKPTLVLSAFVTVMVTMSTSYAGVSEIKTSTLGLIDVGTLTIAGKNRARYRPDNYKELKKNPMMKHINPKDTGLIHQPAHLGLTLHEANARIKFRKLGIQRCHSGFWKAGFEPDDTEAIEKALLKRKPLTLHNVTANKKGECFFESFTLNQ